MNRDVQIKKYAKKFEYSYTLGAFPTIELLKNQPDHVLKVLLHPDMNSPEQLEIISSLCEKNRIPLEWAPRAVEKIRDKENIFAVGVFEKYANHLNKEEKSYRPGESQRYGKYGNHHPDRHRLRHPKSGHSGAGSGCFQSPGGESVHGIAVSDEFPVL
ncbi:MAG: hypothetical protein ACLRT5_15870 [Lachnospiraceae bacterium]